MKKVAGLFLTMIIFCSFYQVNTLNGTWEYAGDIYNGKKEGAPTKYSLQRKYTDTGYTAFVLEKGYEPEKYEIGNYKLNADTCLEMQTWCGQLSTLTNITIHYHYVISNDTLSLHGILPNGTAVTEYWKRINE